ncbi:unnamed protein product [Notodromas monacha]|uniref:Sulfatase N-terminal domain-containing protein n=1 Tax=Notodromas monacha TaxID=399045 RepID=A0A7R9BZG3_9CRUS|nr:unnamed protein product [Notodromas monacha]CAG0922947.1 unnamed protein product [Notodromas monacha]
MICADESNGLGRRGSRRWVHLESLVEIEWPSFESTHAHGGPLSLLGPVDGIDMWAALSEDTPSPRKEILLDLDPILGKSAIRVGNWKLVNAMVYLLDRSVGKIVKALEDKGMLKNSIIVFSTDNGGPAGGINRNAASNWPLRGTKATGWEGGVRGVGFIWSPWLKSSGRVSNQLMHMVDWLPTLFSAAGTWENGTYDTWFGPSGHEDKSYYEITTLKCSSNSSDKYCSNQTPNKQSFRNFMKTGVKRGNGKTFPMSRKGTVRPMLDIRRLTRHHQNPKRFSAKRDPRLVVAVDCGEKPLNASTNCVPTESPCLFDLASDPCEYNNLASQYPGVVDELWRKLMAYQAASVEPINTPSDPLANPKYWGYFWSNWKDFS